MNIFYVFLINMLYGIGFIISKLALSAGSPLFLIASRMLVASIVLLGYQWYSNKSDFRVPTVYVIPLCLFGFLYMYLANAFEFWGLKTVSPTKAAFLYNLSPFIAALITALYQKTKLTGMQWFGIGISFLGSSFLIFADSSSCCFSFFMLSCGELLVLAAIIASIVGSFILQGLVKDQQYSSIMTNGIGMLVGGVCALVHSLLVESWHPVPVTNIRAFIGLALLMVIVYNIIAYELYNQLSRYYTITFLTLSWLTTPFFTAFFEYILLGAPVTYTFVIAYAIVFLGFFFFYYQELRKSV